MMRLRLFGVGFVAACIGVAIVWQAASSGAQNPAEAPRAAEVPLPIRQVVLFNSGVGYFQREGDVQGNSRLDLTFPTGEVNDLLKSLVLQDLGGGRITTVSYDSQDPLEKILRSFALDLNNNPGFGQILNQARGERIEINRLERQNAPLTKITGTIVGMEAQRQPAGKDTVADVDFLNVLGANGLQSIPLAEVVGVKFLNPVLDNELTRALKVLAAAHDTQKKRVSLGFDGVGKRAVRIGYVVERPIWKTTYRLRLEPNGKVFLQGWALVENTSDDDWNDVRMVLVSGKPISYQMNLYEPLYIPRPLVEPELFASLRPPVYGGALQAEGRGAAAKNFTPAAGGMFGQFGQFGMMGAGAPPVPQSQGGPADMGGTVGQIGQFGGQGGFFPGGMNPNRYQQYAAPNLAMMHNRLTYEELRQRNLQRTEARDEAKKAGSAIGAVNFKEGIQSVATAEEVGDYYQYVLDQKVSLARQKSAMVPIVDQTIEGAKVSIFNEDIHGKHPLLGLRLKNTSGKPLTQGPITVYDASNYAGDTRILDLPPSEERLLSYALDQETEVKSEVKAAPSPAVHLRLDGSQLAARYVMRETKIYTIKNRSSHERSVIVEQPIRTTWKLLGTRPREQTRDLYRFDVKVPAGKTVTLEVAEEQPRLDQLDVTAKASGQYAGLLGIGIKVLGHTYEDKVLELKLQANILRVSKTVRESKTYFVQNLTDQDREFTLDHIVRPEWQLVTPPDAPGPKGPNVFQFKMTVPKGKMLSRELIEEQPRVEQVGLRTDGTPHYPVGVGLVFRTMPHSYGESLIDLKIHKGIVQATKRTRMSNTFIVQNNSAEDREFNVDHAIRPEWVLLEDGGRPMLSGPDIFRFKLAVVRGKAASRELKEERTCKEEGHALKDYGDAQLRSYLDHPAPSAPVKAALTKALLLAANVDEAARAWADHEKQLDDLTKDQARVRANLQIVPQSSDHYKQFLEKFVAQETAIDNLQRQGRQLRAVVENRRREHQAFMASLSVE